MLHTEWGEMPSSRQGLRVQFTICNAGTSHATNSVSMYRFVSFLFYTDKNIYIHLVLCSMLTLQDPLSLCFLCFMTPESFRITFTIPSSFSAKKIFLSFWRGWNSNVFMDIKINFSIIKFAKILKIEVSLYND